MDNPNNYTIYDAIDTRRVLVCSDNLDKLKTGVMGLFAIVIFLCFIALSSIRDSNVFERWLFIFLIASLSFFMGLAIYRIYFKRRSVVISPNGIEDSHVTKEAVPWSAVNGVELWAAPALTGQQPLAVRLRLKPGIGDTLKLTWRGRRLFLYDNALYVPVGRGMIVDGYEQSPEHFSRTIEAYAQAYREGAK